MPEKECPYCGEVIKAGAIKCKHCKSNLKPMTKICNNEECNEEIDSDIETCPYCRYVQYTAKKSDSYFTGNSLKSWIIPVVGAIVILYFMGTVDDIREMFNGRNDDETEKAEEVVAVEELSVTYETLEEEIEAIIIGMFGEETNTDKNRIVAVIHDEDEEGEYLQVSLNANENLTAGSTRTSILRNSKDLFEALYKIESDVTYISLFWALSLVDAYGNANDRDVVIVSMDKETADKVNWDNLLTDNIPVIATSYWQHAVLE